MKWTLVSLLFAATLTILDSTCAAQGTGALVGTVTDSSGGVVAGASVTLKNPATGVSRATNAKSDGVYEFPQLLPSAYDIEIAAKGFKVVSFRNVSVRVGITTTLDAQLEIGAANETVEVKAGAAATINTEDASLGTPFTENQISQLPLEGRNIVGLLSLQAGAVYLPTDDIRSGSIQGSRSDETTITLDGVSVDDPENQTAAYQSSLRVTLDSVQEFRTTTTNYGADLGRSSGAQVQLVTKSGTNTLHGSVYEYLRNTATSSNEFFNKAAGQKTPELNKNVFGASAGGPVIKNRFFYFANYEGLREVSGQAILQAVPSESLRDGVIIYPCASAGACPGGTVNGLTGPHSVPQGSFGLTPPQLAAIDPLGIGVDNAVTSYFNQYPVPNDPGQDGENFVGYRFTAPARTSDNTAIVRLDYKLDDSGSRTLFWRGNMQDDTVSNPQQFPGQPPSSGQRVLSKGMVAGFDAVVRTSLVNSFRWGFNHIQQDTGGLLSAGYILFNGLSPIVPPNPTSGRSPTTNEFRDDLTWSKGTHTFQFGADIFFNRIPRFSNVDSYDNAQVNEAALSGEGELFEPGLPTCTTPGCSMVPAVSPAFGIIWGQSTIALWGLVTRGTGDYNYDRNGVLQPVGAPVFRDFATDEYGAYFQDQWRIKPTLTFNYGLRYQLDSPPWELNGNQVSPTPGMGELFNLREQGMKEGVPSNAFPPISLNLSGPANNRPGYYNWDPKDFAPRVSLAWNPHPTSGLLRQIFGDGKTVVRGGYAIAYDRIGLAIANLFDTGGSGGVTGSFGLSETLQTPFGLLNESTAPRFTSPTAIPGSPLIPAAPPGGFPATPPLAGINVYTAIDDQLKSPYVHMFNMSVGRELGGGFTFEATYVGRLGRRLAVRKDYAMPEDLVDTKSGMDYFTAADILAKLAQANTPTQLVKSIPYFEDLFPGAAGKPPFNIYGVGSASTATQVIYDTFLGFHNDFGDALIFLDSSPTLDSKFGNFAYYTGQFCCAYGDSTIGVSNYNSLQLTQVPQFEE
ncbi:MAG: carboxypeptidase-like regulatory domain-containing protein [Candidatus Acidiferrales bacterium]